MQASQALPRTGSSSSFLLAASVGLLVTGIALVVLGDGLRVLGIRRR